MIGATSLLRSLLMNPSDLSRTTRIAFLDDGDDARRVPSSALIRFVRLGSVGTTHHLAFRDP